MRWRAEARPTRVYGGAAELGDRACEEPGAYGADYEGGGGGGAGGESASQSAGSHFGGNGYQGIVIIASPNLP